MCFLIFLWYSDVNDDEFFRNLSTIGGKSGIPGSDSDSDDFSLDDVSIWLEMRAPVFILHMRYRWWRG